MRFLCENHIDRKLVALLRSFDASDVRVVSNDPDPGDTEIVRDANADERIIVTRDRGFPNRRICSINHGTIFIPQRFEGRPLNLPETFDCISRFLESGRLTDLGHGTCTVTPDGVAIRTQGGEESIAVQEI